MLTITTPGASEGHYELLTVAQFKVLANITGTGRDDAITLLLQGLNREAYRELGGRFIKSTGVVYDRVLDCEGGRSLWVPDYPIVSITSIEWVRPTGVGTFEVLRTYTTSDYYINSNAGELVSVMGWPSGTNHLRVKYQAGFAAVPYDLQVALAQWADVRWARISAHRLDALSMAQGETAITFSLDDMPVPTRRVLANYRYAEVGIV